MSNRLVSRRSVLAGAAAAAGAAAMMPGSVSPATGALAAVPPGEGLGQIPAWDAHTHFSAVTGTVPQRVAQLLKYADRVGIERIVMFMGTSFIAQPTPQQFRQQNDEVLQAIAIAPDRVMGFVYLNPHYQRESLAEMDRCVRDGPMLGIKLWIAIECSQPELDPIAQRAGELKIPILQHAYWRTWGNLPGESAPPDVATLALRHPEVSFICAHSGNDWERGFRAIRAAKNVWTEVCGCDPTAGMVEMAVRELGAQRVLYGSDAGGRSFASQLAKVYSADIPVASKRLILRDNLRQLLAPAMKAKGMKV
jgi:predicted TIM-barrel fold metal-dependent hydrolase